MATHVDDVHEEPEDQRRLLAKLVDHPRGYEHLYHQPARAVPRAFLGVDKEGADTLACEAYRTRPVNEACRCAVGRGDAGRTCDEGLLSGGGTAFGTV